MFFITCCHVTTYLQGYVTLLMEVPSRDVTAYVIGGSCDFMRRSFLLQSSPFSSLEMESIVVVEMFLICHVMLQDQTIKRACDMGWSLTR